MVPPSVVAPPPAWRSQRDNVCVGRLHSNVERVLVVFVQGVLIGPSLQEQADLAGGKGPCRGGPGAGQVGRRNRRLTRYGLGAWRDAGARGPGCLFGSHPLRFAEETRTQSRNPGEQAPGLTSSRETPLAAPPARRLGQHPLTPSTACTSGVLPSSSTSAQLTSAPWASAAASAGRSRVRAARCASSPGCSSRTSARFQDSASPSTSPLDSSDSAPSAGSVWLACGPRRARSSGAGTAERGSTTHPPR